MINILQFRYPKTFPGLYLGLYIKWSGGMEVKHMLQDVLAARKKAITGLNKWLKILRE